MTAEVYKPGQILMHRRAGTGWEIYYVDERTTNPLPEPTTQYELPICHCGYGDCPICGRSHGYED